MPVKIDYEKCCWKNRECTSCGCDEGKACEGCVEACPVGALKREDIVRIINNKCISCGACVNACEHGAVSLV